MSVLIVQDCTNLLHLKTILLSIFPFTSTTSRRLMDVSVITVQVRTTYTLCQRGNDVQIRVAVKMNSWICKISELHLFSERFIIMMRHSFTLLF
jgi:hypothetical protein